MKRTVFSIVNQQNIKNSTFVLDEKESHHVISVLRLKINDQLTLTNGQGTIYQAIINETHKKAVKGKILSKEHIKSDQNFKIHLALPLIKNNRFKKDIRQDFKENNLNLLKACK